MTALTNLIDQGKGLIGHEKGESTSAVSRALSYYFTNFFVAAIYTASSIWTLATVESDLPFLDHRFREPTVGIVIALVLALWLVFTIMDLSNTDESSLLAWILVVLVVAPTIVGAAVLRELSTIERAGGAVFALIAVVALAIAASAKPKSLNRVSQLDPIAARNLLLAISLVLIVYVSSVTPPRLSGVEWSELYTFRASFREVATGGVVYAYAFNWQTNVVGPLLMGLALQRRNFPLFLVGAAAQLLLFTISGEKSILFSPAFAIALGFAAQRGTRLSARGVVAGSVVLIALSRLVVLVSGRTDAFLTIGLRLFHVQGLNTLYWIDFFNENPKTRWANGILGVFNQYPYSAPPGFVVGESRGRAANVNANFLGDGFGGWGIGGVLLSVLIVCVYLYILRSLSLRVGAPLTVIAASGPLFSAANSGSVNMLLGGGGVFGLLLLLLMPPRPARGTVNGPG